MTEQTFIKMHGLGNDFVVFDARSTPFSLTATQVRALADRRVGIGCDQLIVMEAAPDKQADAFMRIYNADGGEVAACGNASRCVASLLMAEGASSHTVIETDAGLLDAEAAPNLMVSVDMGPARLDWRDIPVSAAIDTLHLNLEAGPLKDPVGVNVGNPHAVFFVDDAEAIPLESVGPVIETDALFPDFTNVEAAQIIDRNTIRLRVWERGVGITQACGTGACATLIAAARRDLTDRKATVILDGGPLVIEWMADNHVMMTGPVATSFRGVVDVDTLGAS